MHKDIFEKIAQHYSAGSYEAEYKLSRQTYFNMIGSFGEDEHLFENQMTRFLEWYLIDRCLNESAIPPCRLYRLSFEQELNKEEIEILISLENSRHSLFQLHSTQNNGMTLIDLLDKKKEYVLVDQLYPEFRVSDLIDARMFTLNGKIHMTNSSWMYPSEMKEWAIATVNKHFKSDHHRFLIDIAYLKSKRDRFQHVPFDQIFQWEQIGKDREVYLKTKSGGTQSAKAN